MSFDKDFNYPPEGINGEHRYGIDDKIMMPAITCLLLMALLLCLLYIYVRWFLGQPVRYFRRTGRRSASMGSRFYFSGEEPERLRNVGLDSVILGSLPTFVYKSQNFTDGLDCAVCLCEFEENENGRLLPNCRHSFHVECIDMWFRSHCTCPLCRTGAQPEEPVVESTGIEQVSVTIPGPIVSGFQDNRNLEQEQTASRGSEDCNLQNPTNRFSNSGRQKQMKTEMDDGISGGRELMPEIAVDIPKWPNGFSSPGEGHEPCSSNGSHCSSKSPITRLRSLARMVSRDRERTQVFPPDHPAERDAKTNEG